MWVIKALRDLCLSWVDRVALCLSSFPRNRRLMIWFRNERFPDILGFYRACVVGTSVQIPPFFVGQTHLFNRVIVIREKGRITILSWGVKISVSCKEVFVGIS